MYALQHFIVWTDSKGATGALSNHHLCRTCCCNLDSDSAMGMVMPSDRSRWLADACKILLLLLVMLHHSGYCTEPMTGLTGPAPWHMPSCAPLPFGVYIHGRHSDVTGSVEAIAQHSCCRAVTVQHNMEYCTAPHNSFAQHNGHSAGRAADAEVSRWCVQEAGRVCG